MTLYLKRTLFFSLLLIVSATTFSQVTIGSVNSPNSGSLLDLKEHDDPTGGATASKGLSMPRVKLLSFTITNPLTGVASTIDGAPAELWDKDEHIGLMVYHTDDCTLNGKGLYAWTGDAWAKLGNNLAPGGGLELNPNSLLFYNGINTAQNITVSWQSTVGLAPTYAGTGATFTFSPVSGALPTTSPQTLGVSVANMNESELTPNLFASKSGTITFNLANSACVVGGGSETKTISFKQVNKAMKVNGKVIPDQVDMIPSATYTANVESNGLWKLSSITPAVGAAVSSANVNVTKGTELNDGTSATNSITYSTITGSNLYRYNYLTFSDANATERFADIILTAVLCGGDRDLTMRQYVDLWEETFGLLPGVDEPDSDGDLSKNTARVRWHYTRPDLAANDPKQSIYFSAPFGATGRWMITNLQTRYFTPRTATSTVEWAGAPLLSNSYADNAATAYKTAQWGYPNINGTTDAALTTQYDARQRLGILYNWAAATANQNPSTVDQNTVNHPSYQGICPAGWHLPSSVEWNAFQDEVSAFPTQYSTNDILGRAYAGATLKDMCEPSQNATVRGKSFSLFDGGFNAIFGGYALIASAQYNGATTYWSSSSSANPANALMLPLSPLGAIIAGSGMSRAALNSVRCKKD